MYILRKIWYVITLPILALTLLTSPAAKSTESVELISREAFILDEAFFMCQGITTDGEYYYTSGANATLNLTALAKFTCDDMELVDFIINPLPEKCTDRGSDHLGGISVYKGKIYVAIEDGEYLYPCIAVFDCETLESTGEVYDLPLDKFDHAPWCAIDSETGYLYASVWENIEKIYAFDVENSMSFVKEIALNGTEPLNRIQGGELYKGKLYLSSDDRDNGTFKSVYGIDVENGKTELVFARDVGGKNVEAEGLTFTQDENGAVMRVLDYNGIIGVFMHSYKVDF